MPGAVPGGDAVPEGEAVPEGGAGRGRARGGAVPERDAVPEGGAVPCPRAGPCRGGPCRGRCHARGRGCTGARPPPFRFRAAAARAGPRFRPRAVRGDGGAGPGQRRGRGGFPEGGGGAGAGTGTGRGLAGPRSARVLPGMVPAGMAPGAGPGCRLCGAAPAPGAGPSAGRCCGVGFQTVRARLCCARRARPRGGEGLLLLLFVFNESEDGTGAQPRMTRPSPALPGNHGVSAV